LVDSWLWKRGKWRGRVSEGMTIDEARKQSVEEMEKKII
jgi:hypothetical protein